MVTSVGRARWRAAQRGQERAQRAKRAALLGHEAGLVLAVQRRGDAMARRLRSAGGQTAGLVVEVGSGAHGFIWGFPTGRRVAIDPLASFFAREFSFLQRRGDVAVLEARGEELPLPSDSVDVLLSDNVLDHLEDPARCLAELVRVLAPGGLLFLSADVHHVVWNVGARLYNAAGALSGRYPRVPAFPNHPFHFTSAELDRLLDDSGLAVQERHGLLQSAPARWSARRPYDLLKAAFFKNRRVEVLARKRAAPEGADAGADGRAKTR